MEYDGTSYRGFQWQAGQPTVQDELEKALEKVTGQRTRVRGASRTDSGVHAKGQVVSFFTTSGLSARRLVAAINYYLPDDISVRDAARVSDTFNVRKSARRRRYRYTILNRPSPAPILRHMAHHVRQPLEVEAMARAASLLVGTHDFASFCGPLERPNASTVRNVFDVRVARDDSLVTVEMEANAFLPQQVRRTVGALVEVGLHKKTVEELEELLKNRIPGSAGPTLPAKGLCLEEVYYASLELSDEQNDEDL